MVNCAGILAVQLQTSSKPSSEGLLSLFTCSQFSLTFCPVSQGIGQPRLEPLLSHLLAVLSALAQLSTYKMGTSFLLVDQNSVNICKVFKQIGHNTVKSTGSAVVDTKVK